MSPMRSAVALALTLGLAGGCSTAVRPEALQAWVGRPADALKQAWGPATREVEDGGLRILIYEELERRSGSDFQRPATPSRATRYTAAEAAGNEVYRSPTVYVRSYLFWVSREGVIVRADVRQP